MFIIGWYPKEAILRLIPDEITFCEICIYQIGRLPPTHPILINVCHPCRSCWSTLRSYPYLDDPPPWYMVCLQRMLFATSKIASPSIPGAFLLNGLVFTHVSGVCPLPIWSFYGSRSLVATHRLDPRMNSWNPNVMEFRWVQMMFRISKKRVDFLRFQPLGLQGHISLAHRGESAGREQHGADHHHRGSKDGALRWGARLGLEETSRERCSLNVMYSTFCSFCLGVNLKGMCFCWSAWHGIIVNVFLICFNFPDVICIDLSKMCVLLGRDSRTWVVKSSVSAVLS